MIICAVSANLSVFMSFLEWLRQILGGIVAGLFSWLPVSSSGHFQCLSHLFSNVTSVHDLTSLSFASAEIGVSLSLLFIFSYKLNPIAAGKTMEQRRTTHVFVRKVWLPSLWLLAADVLLTLFAPEVLRSILWNDYVLSIGLILMGFVTLLAESVFQKNAPKILKVSDVSLKSAFLIGIFLILCLLSGQSPVDVLLPALLLLGFSRYAAAEMSYYLVIPVGLIDGACRFVRYFLVEKNTVLVTEIFALVVTLGVAMLFSFFVVRKLLHFLKRRSVKVLSVYKILLGLLILILTVVN